MRAITSALDDIFVVAAYDGPVSGEIHRGITVDLNPEQKNTFDSQDKNSKAKFLISQQPYAGMHWTDNEETAGRWAHNPDVEDLQKGHTRFHVVMHAQHPGEEHVFHGERSPRNRNPIFQHSHEWETPLNPGAPVNVHGVSWLDSRSPGYEESAPHDWEMHDPDAWVHHSFDKPVQVTARKKSVCALDNIFTSQFRVFAEDERPDWADADGKFIGKRNKETYYTVTEPQVIIMRTPSGSMAGYVNWGDSES